MLVAKMVKTFRLMGLALVTFIPIDSVTGMLSASESIQYFRHIMFRESPFSPYRGIHPISSAEAQQTAHYQFSYDSLGRVNAISYKIGDKLIANNGNWDSFIWFAPKVTMDYQEGKETHRYFDVDSRPTTAHGKVFSAVYSLDKSGHRTDLHFYDKDGKPSESEWQVHHYNWSKGEDGMVIERRYSLTEEQVSIRPGFDFYEIHLDYDGDGKLQFMYNYGFDGQPTNNTSGAGIDRIYYDKAGNFQRWQVFDKDRNPVEGNLPMVHVGEHLYDTKGNKIGLRGFNRFGQQINFASGEFETENHYDQFGNVIAMLEFDEKMQLINSIQMEFSNDGARRLLVKNLDAAGNLQSNTRWGGAAAIRFDYNNSDLRPAGRVMLNDKLEPMVAEN